MFPTPVPFPSDAVYATVNVRALSYFGNGLAAEIGGSVSTMTNDSVWLVGISPNRGSFVNEYGRYVTLARVRLSLGDRGFIEILSVTRMHGWTPDGSGRAQPRRPPSTRAIG